MNMTDHRWNQGDMPRRIEVVKLEAYHVLSALKDHIRNNAATTSLVPVLGADTTMGRALQEASLTRDFKFLIVKGVPSEDIFTHMDHIRPFLEVMKNCDSKQSKLIILCAEAISKFTQCEAAKFSHKNTANVINETFEELLALFSTNVEPKEDLLTLKILKTLRDILHSRGGNLITNDNICVMFKMIATLLTARHRNTAMRKLIHDEVVNLLHGSLGQYGVHATKMLKSKTLSRRLSSTFIFISLLLEQKTTPSPFNFYVEDSFLSPEDKEIVNRFRNDIALLAQNVIAFPSLWNEFCSDVCVVGLETLNQAMELGSLNQRQYSTVLPIVQVFITNSIYRLCFTESLSLYSLVLRALKNTFSCFRTQMKAQVEVLLTHIITSVVNHVHGTKTYSFNKDIIEMNMEFIVDICHDTQLITEIYANYDCDVRCTNLSDVLIKGILTCLASSQEYDTTLKGEEQVKSKAAPTKGTTRRRASSGLTKVSADATSALNFEYMALNAIQGILRALANNMLETARMSQTLEDSNLAKQKKWKDKLRVAANMFNASKLGDDWIPLIKELALLPKEHTPKDIAMFLKCMPDLDLKKVGEYLGTHKNAEFMDQVRSQFAKLHNFRGLPLVMAIRLFLSSFRLPGESQQIERIIEVFAVTYFESQPLVDETTDKDAVENKDEDIPDTKRPRWVVQENVFWQLNFTSFGIANVGTINDHIANDNENPLERFKKQFMYDEIENILTNERTSLISEAIKDEALLSGMKLTHVKTSTAMEDDPKLAKLKDPVAVQGTIKPGFAYVANSDVIFVLSYSIIMLNTDLHNTQIKRKMKLDDFVRNNKGINNGKNLPFDFLEDIYNTIKHHEIKLHKAANQNEMVQYDNFFWIDHVLHRQRFMGSFNTNPLEDNFDIKRGLFHLLYRNNFTKALNNTFLNAQSLPSLKRCIRILWLMMRAGILFDRHDVVNQIFQMTSINVADSLGYKCQLSLAFMLTAMAVASDMFDKKSWTKVMDTIIRLYYLNLLPLSFAALDIDPHVYGNCAAITDNVIPPTVRFKRNSDSRRGVSWLGGWTNFIAFSKPVNANSVEETDDIYCDFDEPSKLQSDTPEKQQNQQQFLFLFDVQSGCETTIGNPYFNVELLKQGVSPIASKEDSDAIDEVTQAFSNDMDKEELLPQVLAYMNLRLAFLNIYNIKRLFTGVTTNVTSSTYICFMQVVWGRILETAIKERERFDNGENTSGTTVHQGQAAQPLSKVEYSYSHAGALLEPWQKEITQFKTTVEPVLFLGVFTKSCIVILERTLYALKQNDNRVDVDTDTKFRATLIILVKCFHLLGTTMIQREALEHIPNPDEVLNTLGVVQGDTLYDRLCKDDSLALSEETTEKIAKAISHDTVLSSYFCIMLLKLVLWLTENADIDVSVPISPRSEVDPEYTRGQIHEEGQQQSSINTDAEIEIKWSDISISLSAWLLHILIHVDNEVLYTHIDPIVEILSTIASTHGIMANEYYMKVIMAAVQRVTNPNIHFSKKTDGGLVGPARPRKVVSIIGSVLQPLLHNARLGRLLNTHEIIQYVVHTLISVAIINGGQGSPKNGDCNQGLLAIQLLVEMNSFGTNPENDELLWLYAIHALTIICTVGPKSIYVEGMKALTKLLLKEKAPTGKCNKIAQVLRIFDYMLAPSLTNKLQYPLPYARMLMPLSQISPAKVVPQGTIWEIESPFRKSNTEKTIWMQNVLLEYIVSYNNKDIEDLNSRKAKMTNLICQYMLANLPILISMELEKGETEVIKAAASNLECLLYSSDDEACSDVCIKRLITLTNYVLNVIILSNGEHYTDASSDTYLESLKNFLLVLLTAPELKAATDTCLEHFKNDVELKECLNHVRDCVDMQHASAGEYVMTSLVAHIFSTSDFLKDLFLDILRVVFFATPHEEDDAEEKEDEAS